MEVVTAAVEVRVAAMGAAGTTSNHPNTVEATTTSLRATTPPLHRAIASRASMVKLEVPVVFLLAFYVKVVCEVKRSLTLNRGQS